MSLNFQNIFRNIKGFKYHILLTLMSIIFFFHMGVIVGYLYYLYWGIGGFSPNRLNIK